MKKGYIGLLAPAKDLPLVLSSFLRHASYAFEDELKAANFWDRVEKAIVDRVSFIFVYATHPLSYRFEYDAKRERLSYIIKMEEELPPAEEAAIAA